LLCLFLFPAVHRLPHGVAQFLPPILWILFGPTGVRVVRGVRSHADRADDPPVGGIKQARPDRLRPAVNRQDQFAARKLLVAPGGSGNS
jgi:hypothetical protein